MTKTFFASRTAARNANIGTVRDAGADAPAGNRWYVEVAPLVSEELAPPPAEIKLDVAALPPVAEVKESALGTPMPANSVRFDSLPIKTRFTTPDLKGVYIKVSETRGQAEAVNGTLSQLFEGDEYVLIRPIWTNERNTKGDVIADEPKLAAIYAQMDYYGLSKTTDSRSRNQREGRYAGRGQGFYKRIPLRHRMQKVSNPSSEKVFDILMGL